MRIETTAHVKMNSRGQVTGVTKGRPRLGRDEIAFKLYISIPESVFRSPVFEADIEVLEGHIITPKVDVQLIDEGLPADEEVTDA